MADLEEADVVGAGRCVEVLGLVAAHGELVEADVDVPVGMGQRRLEIDRTAHCAEYDPSAAATRQLPESEVGAGGLVRCVQVDRRAGELKR
jgi:hypothetical protein